MRKYVVHMPLLAMLLLGASACTRPRPPAVEGAPVFAPTAAIELEQATERARIFGTEGELLESEIFAGGVKLPRGLRERSVGSSEFVHVFETNVELAALLRYFGPRLLTGNVERRGERVTYRAANPRDVPVRGAQVDVSIAPVAGGKIVIEIRELRVGDAVNVRSEAEVNRIYSEMQKTAR